MDGRRIVRVGDQVRVLAGRRAGEVGEVTAVIDERSCGCRSLIVRLPSGEWFGKRSEVELVDRSSGGLIGGSRPYLIGERDPEPVR